MSADEPDLTEEDAYPARPDNEYGWEKLYSERMAMAYQRRHGMVVRIARFQNCYGPYGTWEGGREKAPAAISRKIAGVEDGGTIEIWGDGTAMRTYIYVDDLVDGIRKLMESDMDGPTNIGTDQRVSVNELVDAVAQAAGKTVKVKHVEGPVGVQARNHSNDRIRSLGWRCGHDLQAGIAKTYPWVAEQVKSAGRA
jgi:nucleoside-diphosphate-sugar epimerase